MDRNGSRKDENYEKAWNYSNKRAVSLRRGDTNCRDKKLVTHDIDNSATILKLWNSLKWIFLLKINFTIVSNFYMKKVKIGVLKIR